MTHSPLCEPDALWKVPIVKLPHLWMAKHGELAQTLAGILSNIPRDSRKGCGCFASAELIGECCGLPVSTVRKHMKRLLKLKLLRHDGRQKRRTVTYATMGHLRITWKTTLEDWRKDANYQAALQREREAGNDAGDGRYGLLPRWISRSLTWNERAVFSIAVSKHKAAIIAGDSPAETEFTMRYKDSAETTGLSERSVGRALKSLETRGMLKRLRRNGKLQAQYWTISNREVELPT